MVRRLMGEKVVSRRARRLMHWYPSRWRERYGEEFAAHMEQEYAEKPRSFRRTFNVAILGTRARFTSPVFQRTPFLTFRIGLAATAVLALALLWNSHFGAVSLDTSYVLGMGNASTPGKILVFPVSLGSNTHDEIRLLSVKLIPLPGYLTPKLIGARLVNQRGYPASELSWPLKTSSTTKLNARLVDLYTPPSGFGTQYVVYGVVGVQPHVLYATEGVSITYVHNGTTHSADFYWAATDCVVSTLNAAARNWCDSQSSTAFTTLNVDLGIHADKYFRHAPEM
jgi:hypothetical protein